MSQLTLHTKTINEVCIASLLMSVIEASQAP
jgi:hypothetical protein